MKRVVISMSLLVATASLAWGFYDASRPVGVYAPVDGFEVVRRRDDDGNDRIYVSSTVHKLLDCDLESGDGPPWVDFYDSSDTSNPPPSAFYRPDGFPAGNTMGDAGEAIAMAGYSAIVPNKMRDQGGTFVIRVPCQLWTVDGSGYRTWGRKVIGSWGPVPVPMPSQTKSQARTS